jgi:hypothetical protein
MDNGQSASSDFLFANKITVSGRKNPEVYDLAGVFVTAMPSEGNSADVQSLRI